MSFFLQNPALLGILALAGLPLLVHLLSRAKPPEFRFSNIEFLRKAIAQTTRFKKPKDWLLLLLRSLAILTLAAAFLLPVILSENTPLPGEKRSVILIIDRSASMAATEDATSRFNSATKLAAEILSGSRPDLANIIWIDSSPSAIFPEPAPNLNFLRDELARATPRPEPGATDAAIELALRQLSDSPGRREIHIISDFQKTAWEKFSPSLPKDIKLTMHPVAKTDVPNLAVSSLIAIPSSPVAGQNLIAQARVVNHSKEPRRVSLTLDAGGSRQSQDISLPANGEAEAAFTVRLPNPGILPLTAEIDADSFPADDRRHNVIRVRESLRIAVLAPQNHPATVTLSRVAGSLPWLELTTATDISRLPPCDILCLSEWMDFYQVEKIREIAKTTGILVFPASSWSDMHLRALLGSSGQQSSSTIEQNTDGWQASPDSNHPAFRLFAQGQFGNPLEGKTKERIRFSTDLPGNIIARFSDNLPALIIDKSLPILISAIPLDPAKSSWPTESPFLPALAELILHLAPTASTDPFNALPGDFLSWTNTATDNAIAPILEAPDSSSIPLESSATTYRSTVPAVPGIHRWLVSGQPVQINAVNFPESESKLTPMENPPTGKASNASIAIASKSRLDQGLDLWPLLVAACLLFLFLEPLAERFISTAKKSPETSKA